MRSSHSLDRLDVAFDGAQLVADAGLLLPATLAQQLGVKELVEESLDLGTAPGRANVGDKLCTLVASALAGGDCIDDAAALRAGGTGNVLGFTVKAASALGTFLRSFRRRLECAARGGPLRVAHRARRRRDADPLRSRVHRPAPLLAA
jgi:hypothetical protein